MAKAAKKQQKTASKVPDISFSIRLSPGIKKIILGLLLILSVALPYYYINNAYSVNRFNSFPLDDTWIHLTFAKNLVEYGSFSYYKNEVVTAGSTSPLYTFVMAAGFFIVKNEMLLGYALGILFFLVSVFYFYRLAEDTFPRENWLAIAAGLIFVLDKWVNFISATGMETTMCIFFLLACFYYYRKGNALAFALTLGLSFWTRPDTIAFIAAVAIDYAVLIYLKRKSPKENQNITLFSKKDMFKIGAVTGGILAAYFVMNLLISGSLLPNSYGAKIAYYLPELATRRPHFLQFQVWGYFTESAYSLLIIPLLFAIIKIINDTVKLRYNNSLTAVIFIFALIFIYWYKLPYSHLYGRYMMPILPFYILLSVYGLREFFRWLVKYIKDVKLSNAVNIMYLAAIIIYFGAAYFNHREFYADKSRHIYIRQVETAMWLKNNTPEGSVIATHDIGAIGFYSGRKVVDVVGLVNPEFIPKIHTPQFVAFMTGELKKQNVSYTAFLREWFQISNQPILLQAGENNYEIMQVYRYYPDKTHILSPDVNSTLMYAGEMMNEKKFQQALPVLNKLAAADPNASMTFLMLGYAYGSLGDDKSAEKNLLKAIELFPDYKEAVFALSNLYISQKKLSEAKNLTGNYLKNNTLDTAITRLYNSLNDSAAVKNDSLKLK